MTFVWKSWRELRGIESKQVALERGSKVYGGILKYDPVGGPYLLGHRVYKTRNEFGPSETVPLKEGDISTLLK